MKLLIKILLFSALTLLLSSCGDINQEMWLNKDGSGKIEFSTDMGDALPMLTMMMQGAAQEQLKDAPNGEKTKETMDKIMDKISSGTVDTSFSIFQIMPDSVKREMDNAEKFKKMNFNIFVDSDNSKALMKLGIDFTNFKEIDQLFGDLFQAFGSGRPELENFNIQEMTGGNSFDGSNYFSKKEFKQRSMNKPDDPGVDELLGEGQGEEMMNQLFANTNFVKTYHFPYDVKSVSGADAEIDGKTVVIKQEMIKMIKENKSSELNVKFKKKFLGIF